MYLVIFNFWNFWLTLTQFIFKYDASNFRQKFSPGNYFIVIHIVTDRSHLRENFHLEPVYQFYRRRQFSTFSRRLFYARSHTRKMFTKMIITTFVHETTIIFYCWHQSLLMKPHSETISTTLVGDTQLSIFCSFHSSCSTQINLIKRLWIRNPIFHPSSLPTHPHSRPTRIWKFGWRCPL